MAEPIHDKIIRSIQTAEGLYYRLVLLVGETGSGKTAVLRDIAEEFGTLVININLELSRELLELSERQRSLRLPEILADIVNRPPQSGKPAVPVLLDNIEILFDKDLRLDPLRILQGISRNKTIVSSWNGAFKNERLLYAKTGHPEYRSYNTLDALIINMEEK